MSSPQRPACVRGNCRKLRTAAGREMVPSTGKRQRRQQLESLMNKMIFLCLINHKRNNSTNVYILRPKRKITIIQIRFFFT